MLTSLFPILYVQSALPDFWKAIALRLWPAYYDPEVREADPFQNG